MNRLLVAVAEQSFIATTKLTVREYLQQEWLPAAMSTVRPSTYNSYVQHVDCHVVPFIGSVKLQKLSGATLNGLYARLAASGRKCGKRGLSPMTVHHVHSCLHRALRDAVRWGRLVRNPADAADPPRLRGSAHEMRTWSAEQLQAFLGSTRQERLGGLWHLLALTGMRRGEGLGLRWEDVDLQAGRLAVRRALIPTGGEVVVSEPKTAKGRRVIALDATTVEVLKTEAARQLGEQSGTGWVDSGYVFTRRCHIAAARSPPGTCGQRPQLPDRRAGDLGEVGQGVVCARVPVDEAVAAAAGKELGTQGGIERTQAGAAAKAVEVAAPSRRAVEPQPTLQGEVSALMRVAVGKKELARGASPTPDRIGEAPPGLAAVP